MTEHMITHTCTCHSQLLHSSTTNRNSSQIQYITVSYNRTGGKHLRCGYRLRGELTPGEGGCSVSGEGPWGGGTWESGGAAGSGAATHRWPPGESVGAGLSSEDASMTLVGMESKYSGSSSSRSSRLVPRGRGDGCTTCGC